MSELEYRTAVETWPEADLAVRAVETDTADPLAGLRFSGYAAVFSAASEPLPGPRGSFRETIAPGAFTKTLSERGHTIKAFWNHDTSQPLASVNARSEVGRLTLTTDSIGLRADWTFLPEHRTYAALVAAGVADSMSFGFQTVKDTWSSDGKQRTLDEVRLLEVSLVGGWPAYSATSASVRALAEDADIEPDVLAEAFRVLRDPEARLTPEQRHALIVAINSRSDMPVITHVAKWQERLDALA